MEMRLCQERCCSATEKQAVPSGAFRLDDVILTDSTTPPVGESERHTHTAVSRSTQRRESKDLGVMFVCQIVDSPEDCEVRIELILRGDIDERIILNIEIRSAEIQFFTRIHEFRFDRRSQFLAPEI